MQKPMRARGRAVAVVRHGGAPSALYRVYIVITLINNDFRKCIFHFVSSVGRFFRPQISFLYFITKSNKMQWRIAI